MTLSGPQGRPPRELHDASVVFGGFGLYQLLAVGLQSRKGTRFVGGHEPAIADDVGGEDRDKPLLFVLPPHPSPQTTARAVSSPDPLKTFYFSDGSSAHLQFAGFARQQFSVRKFISWRMPLSSTA